MFDDTTPNQNAGPAPVGGPLPGEPLQPMGTPVNVRPMTAPPSAFQPLQPSTPPPLPPLPPSASMDGGSGGKTKKIILIVVIVLLLIAAGVAVAFLLPTKQQDLNTNTVTNTTTNTVNTNVKSNTNTTANLSNKANAGTNLTNGTSLNTNAFNANTKVTNTTNSVLNTNSSLNANTNTVKNVNTNTNIANANTNTALTNTPPASYSVDTDNDNFNNYLEGWMMTNPKVSDSDHDGFLDGKEVAGGYSPLSKGKLSVAGLESYCATSPLVAQYGFTSTDSATFCGIAGDILSKIQIMATNTTFYEDLDSLLSRSCTSFGKIDNTSCEAVVKFLVPAYAASNSTS